MRIAHMSLATVPPEIRDCISEMRRKACVEKWEPSYVARQLWFTVKKKLIDLVYYAKSLALTPMLCQAKRRYVQFHFLLNSNVHRVRLEVAELEAL